MQHPYEVLEPEYSAQIANAQILPSREAELKKVCNGLLIHEDIYQQVASASDVPTAFLMALSEREMSGNIHCYLGNGQPLNRVTTIVPKHRGPWRTFLAGAMDALQLDGLTAVKDWTLPRAAYEGEIWNGPGYRNHGIPSPYVFGGTTVQLSGKFVEDHKFDPDEMDTQLGIIAIIEELFNIKPSLRFADAIEKVDNAPSIVMSPVPAGLGGDINVFLLQQRLNALHVPGTPLSVDGRYGRATTRAVKSFQWTHHLVSDGLVGPKTIAALKL